jgi:hypothetical protein
MKRLPIIFLLTLLATLGAWAAQLVQFSGEVLDDEAVELRWRVDSVQGVASFEVERSTDNVHYQALAERVTVDDRLEYTLLDRPGLASASQRGRFTDIEQVYYYRLYYVLPGGGRLLAQATPLEVNFQFSTVEATWGSIKAMFR